MNSNDDGVAINIRGVPEETRRRFKAKCASLGMYMGEALTILIENWCSSSGDDNNDKPKKETSCLEPK